MLLPLPPLAARALAQAQSLIAAGRLAEASAATQQARRAAPSHPGVPAGVADALAKKGLAREALVQRFLACRLAPEDAALRRALAEALPGADLTGASPAVQGQLIQLLHAPDVSPLTIGPTILALVKTLPGFGFLALPGGLDEHLNDPAVRGFLEHPLWLSLLSRCLQTDPAIETLLTRLREVALTRWREGQGGGFLTPALEPLAALALQADLGSHAWSETPAEQETLRQLQAHLDQTPPASLDAAVLLLACYRPLPATWQLAEPPGRRLLHATWSRLLEEPRRRQAHAAAVPGLTPVEDPVSRRVQAWQEPHPYPRWIATGLPPSRTLAEVLGALFPWVPANSLPRRKPLRILVAGCGTGEQAVRTARRFADAQVLAVDISRGALGHAMLRAEALALPNLRFAQADILTLGRLEQRFDLIESIGALHHLADPAAGWRVLRGLLAPQGVMRIGLYSRQARQPLAKVRALLETGGERPATTEQLRAARARLWTHSADPAVRYTLSFYDSYDLDGLRNLLFHVQETAFTLPEIQRLLDGMKLSFLGLELSDRALRDRFRQAQPKPAAERDLAAWDAFETTNPDCFAGMYCFWCQAA